LLIIGTVRIGATGIAYRIMETKQHLLLKIKKEPHLWQQQMLLTVTSIGKNRNFTDGDTGTSGGIQRGL
jgi:hypothetical protein